MNTQYADTLSTAAMPTSHAVLKPNAKYYNGVRNSTDVMLAVAGTGNYTYHNIIVLERSQLKITKWASFLCYICPHVPTQTDVRTVKI